jgi:hypothetical protein
MTAVEWLWQITHEREIDKFDWEQALEMENHQMPQGILSIGEKPEITFLEISDEEIWKLANEIGSRTKSSIAAQYFYHGAEWYREQLKQRK